MRRETLAARRENSDSHLIIISLRPLMRIKAAFSTRHIYARLRALSSVVIIARIIASRALSNVVIIARVIARVIIIIARVTVT